MSPEFTGPVPGSSRDEQSVFLAGLLAELGVKRVVLQGQGGSRVLEARVTDLPGEIAAGTAGGPAVLVCESIGLRVELGDALRWRTTDPRTASGFSHGM